MLKIVQISDTHLIGSNSSLFGIDPSLRLKRAFESILKYHSDASFVVITGDLANAGESMAYEKLKKLMDDFPMSVYFIPGNHDKIENIQRYFDDYKDLKFIQYEKTDTNRAFIFLDSTIEGEEFGGMDRSRLKWLEEHLKINRDKDVYLFMHHFPLISNLPWMDKHANFRSKEDFFNLIEGFGNIKHIFCGHLHRIIDANYKHISISCTRSTTFQVAYRPNCEDDYLTNEENPTYCVAIIERDSLLLHHHEFLQEELIYPGQQW